MKAIKALFRKTRRAPLFLVALITLAFLAWLALGGAPDAPNSANVRDGYRPSEGQLLDRHGEVLHEIRIDPNGRRLSWVAISDISPVLLDAVVRAEDKRFYQHHGVDWLALVKGFADTVGSDTRRGASTLTMQLAAEVRPALKPKVGRRSLRQKWQQLALALEIERSWSKAEILEAYLNLVTFRGELQGIHTASRALFQKSPGGLDLKESVVLAVLLRGPNAEAATIDKRACTLGRAIRTPFDCSGLTPTVQAATVNKPSIQHRIRWAPHVARQLMGRKTPRVLSTLDGNLQRYAAETLRRELGRLSGRNVKDGAVLVLDNATAGVLAYVGNGGPASSSIYVDGVQARRQAGSTLKPFLYELAIERRLLTAVSLIDDAPVNVATPTGLYVPRNYDGEFKGLVSVRESLAGSLNIPAVKTVALVGINSFVSRLRELGFSHLNQDGDYYGDSLALGSAEVTLWQLAAAYRALAMAGEVRTPALTINTRTESRAVMQSAAAFIVSDVLSDRAARAASFGLENPLATRYWSAAKTGTSKDMRDNWCIGFSPRYTVAVWVGNFDGSPMHDVSGVTGAAPVWLAVMNYLHASDGSDPPTIPNGVVKREIQTEVGEGRRRSEYFLAETAMDVLTAKRATQLAPRIVYPRDGEIIALDPDIPVANQRVLFEAQGAAATRWTLNDEAGASAQSLRSWVPRRGRFSLNLQDQSGKVLDRVAFEVRGSGSGDLADLVESGSTLPSATSRQ